MSQRALMERILIVDDSKSVRHFLLNLLDKAGYALVTAENGQLGWETVQRENIDIIISDLEMPEVNGFEFCKLVKEHPEYRSIYFILLSTREGVSDKVHGLEIGADDYMGKSISESELLARVRAGLRIRTLERELDRGKVQILQNEKMASIGKLAAGVAHEINNPLFTITLNMDTLKQNFDTLSRSVGTLSSLIKPESIAEFEQFKEEQDLDFICEDSAELIRESVNEMTRIKQIVTTLKASSEVHELDPREADINQCLDDAIDNVCKNFSSNISLRKQFGPLLPYKCQELLLTQAFMQLFTNSFQAVNASGEIEVSTRSENGWLTIVISDNGVGISDTDIKRIFDPFFTTKNVGQGLGLGLSVAYDTIHNRHHGDIRVNSILGQKTTFTITLPLNN